MDTKGIPEPFKQLRCFVVGASRPDVNAFLHLVSLLKDLFRDDLVHSLEVPRIHRALLFLLTLQRVDSLLGTVERSQAVPGVGELGDDQEWQACKDEYKQSKRFVTPHFLVLVWVLCDDLEDACDVCKWDHYQIQCDK